MPSLGINKKNNSKNNTQILKSAAITLYDRTFDIEDKLNELKDAIAQIYEAISELSFPAEDFKN